VTSRALGFVDLSACFKRAVRITNFHRPNFLDAHGRSFFSVDGASGRLVGRCHIKNQANDDENWNEEGSQTQQKHLLGCFDGACVVFVLIVAVVAHEILFRGVATMANILIAINLRL
jgi:hypothetical protein